MKRLVTALGALLLLALGLGQGDARLPAASLVASPGAPTQAITPPAFVPKPYITRRPSLTPPRFRAPRAPGDVMPHSYLVFGLQAGPHGMVCTDRNGAALPIPFNPQITLGPRAARPAFPPTFVLPRLTPLPAPKR